jgi:hypothetical protein
VYTAISIFGLRSGGGTAHYAHLGGLVGAFLYLQFLSRNAGAKKFRSMAVAPKPASVPKTLDLRKVDPQKVHEVNRDELNRILDKVGKSGMSSLSPDELRFLMNFVPPDDRPPIVH